MSSLFTHEDKDAASNTFWKPGTAAPRPTHTRTGGKHEPSGAFQKASHRESVKAKEDTRLIAKQGLSATILDRHGEEEDGVFPVYNPRMKMPLEQQRQLLPIFRYRDTLLYALEHHLTVILVGETGSGKTTQIPQYLYEAGWTDQGYTVACTQPRRVAASSVAARVANEMGVPLGMQVGYAVQFDDCTHPEYTRIKFVTDGLLLREMMVDPLLSRYSVIVVDEAHERGLNTDLLVGLLKRIQLARKDLRIIVSSATLDASKFRKYFERDPSTGKRTLHKPVYSAHAAHQTPRKRTRWGSHGIPVTLKENDKQSTGKQMSDGRPGNRKLDDSPPVPTSTCVIAVEGRQYPVDILYSNKPVENYVSAAVETALNIHNLEGDGDILIFLPGAEEIDTAVEMLEQHAPPPARQRDQKNSRHGMIAYPLYASLPYQDQMAAIQPGPKVDAAGNKIRKVIVATNIAETSVTLEGVSFVIDSGFVKMPVYDPTKGVETLVAQPVSKASAEQRAGRAGRVSPGKCFRLYTETSYKELQKSTPPEMTRVNVTPAILQMKALGIKDIAHFEFLDAPPPESVIRSLQTLYALGAIDENAELTQPWGTYMAEFPASPNISAMLLRSLLMGCAEEALTVAAMVSVKNVFAVSAFQRKLQELLQEYGVSEGDHLTLFNIYNAFLDNEKSKDWCNQNGLNYAVLQRAVEIRSHLRKYLKRIVSDSKFRCSDSEQDDETLEEPGALDPRSISCAHIAANPVRSCGEEENIVRKCITAGYFMHAAKLSPRGYYETVHDGVRIDLHSSSVLARFGAAPEWILFHEAVQTEQLFVREAIVIDPRWLLELAPGFFEATHSGSNSVWAGHRPGDASARHSVMDSKHQVTDNSRHDATNPHVESKKESSENDLSTVRFRPASQRDTKKKKREPKADSEPRGENPRRAGGGRKDWRTPMGGISSVLEHLRDD